MANFNLTITLHGIIDSCNVLVSYIIKFGDHHLDLPNRLIYPVHRIKFKIFFLKSVRFVCTHVQLCGIVMHLHVHCNLL